MRDYYRLRGLPVRVQCSSGTINGVLHSVTDKTVWLLVAGDDRFVPVADIVTLDVAT
jgi:hypothetical protein